MDPDGLFLQVNPAFHRIFGYPPEEMPGESFVDMAVEEERRELQEWLEGLTRGDGTREMGEHRYEARDETVLWAKTKMSLIRDEKGEPDQLVVLFEDISEASAWS